MSDLIENNNIANIIPFKNEEDKLVEEFWEMAYTDHINVLGPVSSRCNCNTCKGFIKRRKMHIKSLIDTLEHMINYQ